MLHFSKNILASKYVVATSVGDKTASNINPVVVDAIMKVVYDITSQNLKDITEDMMRNSTTIVNMGCVEKRIMPHAFFK